MSSTAYITFGLLTNPKYRPHGGNKDVHRGCMPDLKNKLIVAVQIWQRVAKTSRIHTGEYCCRPCWPYNKESVEYSPCGSLTFPHWISNICFRWTYDMWSIHHVDRWPCATLNTQHLFLLNTWYVEYPPCGSLTLCHIEYPTSVSVERMLCGASTMWIVDLVAHWISNINFRWTYAMWST